MNNDVKCECGERIPLTRMRQHRQTIRHRCELSLTQANRRGHFHSLSSTGGEPTARMLMAAGYDRHFSIVLNPPHGNREHLRTSTRMVEMLYRFASVRDDMPEETMHAALVFSEVYGTEAPRIILSVMEAELGEARVVGKMGSTFIAEPDECSLIAILRANGVYSPARALANLSPHLLRACAEAL